MSPLTGALTWLTVLWLASAWASKPLAFETGSSARAADADSSDYRAERELAYRYRPAAPPPPWLPGMAPPVPGPVFSPAFKALLVLLVIGCGVLGVNLKQSLDAMRASTLGEDNVVLTSGQPGTAAWLRDVQLSKGIKPSLKPREIRAAIDEEAASFGGRKKKGKSSKGSKGDEEEGEGRKSRKHRKAADEGDEYEMNGLETEALRPKKSGSSRSKSSSGHSKPK